MGVLMRRGVIGVTCLLASIVPLAIAIVFFAGCCILPFHQVLHKVAPLCSIAAWGMKGDQQDGDRQPVQAPQKNDEVAKKSVPTNLTARFALATGRESERLLATALTQYRAVISLGAVRCDDDVGLRLSLLDTYRI